MLESIKPKNVNPEDIVFKSKKGSFIDTGKFHSHAWKGYKNRHGKLIPGIAIRLFGKENYRCLYQARHTFITLCLEAGMNVKDVSRIVGNSPEVIYRHYAGKNRSLVVPEL